jgi:hypothetical protein
MGGGKNFWELNQALVFFPIAAANDRGDQQAAANDWQDD